MAIFYEGAAIGTWWHDYDASSVGFRPRNPVRRNSSKPDIHRLMDHIARGTTTSPFLSLTRSYDVARTYAQIWRRPPRAGETGVVYEIEIKESDAVKLVDPVKQVAAGLPKPYDVAYQHDGLPDFLLGVVAPKRFPECFQEFYGQPPGNHGTPRPPNLSIQVETLVRSIRDAEILVMGSIPASCVKARWSIEMVRQSKW